MTFGDMVNIINRVTYKHGWHVGVFRDEMDSDRPYLQVTFAHGNGTQKGRKWMLSYHMTKSELVRTAFLAFLTAEEHECREAFRFDDATIFSPHIDIEALKDASVAHDRRNPFPERRPYPHAKAL